MKEGSRSAKKSGLWITSNIPIKTTMANFGTGIQPTASQCFGRNSVTDLVPLNSAGSTLILQGAPEFYRFRLYYPLTSAGSTLILQSPPI